MSNFFKTMFSSPGALNPQDEMRRMMFQQQLGNLGAGLMQAGAPVPFGQSRAGMFGRAIQQGMPDPRQQMMMMQMQQQAAAQKKKEALGQQLAQSLQPPGQIQQAGGSPFISAAQKAFAAGDTQLGLNLMKMGQGKGPKLPTGMRQNATGQWEYDPNYLKGQERLKRAGKTDITNVLPGAKTKIGKSVSDRDTLVGIYGEDHPSVKAIDREMASVGVDKTKAAEERKKMLNLARGEGSLNRYEALLREHGTEITPGKKQAELGAAHTDLMMELKELFNLGVLNGPDLELMLKVVNDPTTISAGIKSGLSQLMGTGDPFQAQLDLVRKKYDEARKKAREMYRGNKVPESAVQTQSQNDPLGIR